MTNQRYLSLGKNAFGEEIWVCGHCGKPANHVTEEKDKNKDEVAYSLICPDGNLTLGQWKDLATKNAELAAYKQRLIRFSEDITQA